MARSGVKRERTCIGCGAKAGKTELFRIVRTPEGAIRFDPTGRAAGRGAYVCSTKCFDAANGAGKLQRALRAQVRREDADSVAAELGASCPVQAS